MNGRQGLLWKRVRQHMGHLGPGGGGGEGLVQLRADDTLRLEITQVPEGRGLILGGVGAWTCLRVSGAVQTADAAGENHHLPNGQLVSQAESAVGLAYGETIRIQRRHIVVERGLRRQVGELAGVGFAADKIVRGVLGGPGGDSKSKRQCQHQRGDPFLHDGTSLYKMEDRIQDFCLMEQNADRGLFRRGCPNPPWSGPPHRDSGTG